MLYRGLKASRQKTNSTPAVVPGAAPALVKAGVGGYHCISIHGLTSLPRFWRHWSLALIILRNCAFFLLCSRAYHIYLSTSNAAFGSFRW